MRWDTEELAPAPACPGPPTRLGNWQATGLLTKDQPCLKTLQPTRPVSCFKLGTAAPLFIYTDTRHARVPDSPHPIYFPYSHRETFYNTC